MSTKPTLPTPTAPPPPFLDTRAEVTPRNYQERKQKGLPARVPRRPEEGIPAANYVALLESLGPRPGESLLAFRKRMYMIKGVRELWAKTWRDCGGNRPDAARTLGIPPNNVAFELRSVGLSKEILDNYLLGKVELS